MKYDFLGRELYCGDHVVVLRQNKKLTEFCKCEIIGFTDAWVKVMQCGEFKPFFVLPSEVIKVNFGWI